MISCQLAICIYYKRRSLINKGIASFHKMCNLSVYDPASILNLLLFFPAAIDDDDDAICFMQSPSSQCIIVCTKSAEGYEEVITPTEREDGM